MEEIERIWDEERNMRSKGKLINKGKTQILKKRKEKRDQRIP